MLTASTADEKFAAVGAQLAQLTLERDAAVKERDAFRKLYMDMLALCRKLELGLLQKRERHHEDSQVTLSLLGMLFGEDADKSAAARPVEKQEVPAHTRVKPTGRKPLPEKLPRVDIEVLPPEVQAQGLDAFERIGEDVSETVERRPSAVVVVRVHKPKFVPKGQDRLGESCVVLQAAPPELPIESGLAGPGLLAETIVRRWEDHLPLHRLERIYGREGLPLARSTICGWHKALASLVGLLIDAMWKDAFLAPYLCADATGVLVQDIEKCRRGHFFVVAAPEKHVLFGYTPKHDANAVDELLKGYKGYLVVDAHSVYNHLFASGEIVECGCAAHARRYYWKALASDPLRAKQALSYFGALFNIERAAATFSPDARKALRLKESKPVLDAYFAWCDSEAPNVIDETPIAKAIQYSQNQRDALSRFLEDGRIPIHNNFSERELRREAIGRRNWTFVGSDDGGEVNAAFVTLLASCKLNNVEPLAYLRDLFCLLPSWPSSRVLELAPAFWKKTFEDADTQQRLAANVFRPFSLNLPVSHPTKK